MFRYNPKANYQPNRGRYLQILSGKDLYKQTIVVSAMENDGVPRDQRALTFPARFPNIFVDYPLGQMRVGDKLWTNWNKAPLKLWQTQLNYAVFCASSACGVSSAHLNYTKHPMIRSVYRQVHAGENKALFSPVSRLLSREKNFEKNTGASATRDRF